MSFEKLIGNKKVKRILNNIVESNNVLHSYMFIGKTGIGKKEFAKEFAKSILCNEEYKKPCENCKSCIGFEENNNPDFKMIEADGKSIKIDQIRELTEKIVEKPIISSKKVYIINDADCMTKEAQNCLLKTLEEPPEYAVLILIVENESKMLNTIRSRCIKIEFNIIEKEELKLYMNNISDNILEACGGSIGKLNSILEKKEMYEEIENFVEKMHTYNALDILNNAEILYNNKEDILEILDYMIFLLYKRILENKSIRIINIIEEIEKTKKRIISNSNFDMSIDNLLFNITDNM